MKIGIVGRGVSNTFGVNKMYMEFARRVALHIDKSDPVQISVIYPYSTEVDKSLDLLILPGGADVLDFSTTPTIFTGSPDLYYEYFDKVMLPRYIETGVAIFGICRGFQSINIAFGGTIYDEIFEHDYSDIEKKGRGDRVHEITFQPEFEKHIGQLPKTAIKVNSLHHQGVHSLGDALLPLVKAEDKKWTHESLVESFIHERLPIAGVQWHPEEIFCRISMRIIGSILERSHNTSKGELAEILEEYGLE